MEEVSIPTSCSAALGGAWGGLLGLKCIEIKVNTINDSVLMRRLAVLDRLRK